MCKRLFVLLTFVVVLSLFGANVAFGTTIELGIATELDDSEEDINPSKLGENDADSSDLEIPYEDTGMGDPQFAGVRYEVGIPKGALITDAWVLFQVDELKDGSLPVNLIIEGELSPNAAQFVEAGPGTFDISTRPTTTAQVKWSVANWENVGDRGPAQTTPNLAPIIQEIVNQDGWASGNALVLIFRDDPDNPSQGNRVIEAGPGDDSAMLHVEFGGDPFLQDSGPDGIVSMEAENFHNNVPQGAHTWELVGPTDGFTGVAGMQSLPNDGLNANLDRSIEPHLDYDIALLKTGTYYVWIRAWAAGGSDDSVNIDLDGQVTDTADQIDGYSEQYVWTNSTRDPERATLDVTDGGVHVLNLYMREDGAIVDKIVLTTNPDYVPEGDGPPESERGLPVIAFAPIPADGAVEVDAATLEWTGPDAAVSHKVYLSTDETIDESDFLAETDLTIQIADLAPGTTYYWRVDEVQADGTVTEGMVWTFVTIALEAHFPSPIDGAVWARLDTQLSWTPGKVVIMHNVHLGTDPAMLLPVSMMQMGTSYDPGPLEVETTYYWRVDEFTPTGTVTGPVWSFSTEMAGMGGVKRETWENIDTTELDALKSDPRFPAEPTTVDEVPDFLSPDLGIDNYGGRLQALLHVPVAGEYTFWVSGDDNTELFLETTPGKANLIASVPGWSSPQEYEKYPEQKSEPVTLEEGVYYIMAMWKEGGGGDNCDAAWQGPGVPERAPITGNYLKPFDGVWVDAPSFSDDFNRADGDVGNDWATVTDGTIEVKIVDNEVLIAGTQGTDWVRSGLSRDVVDETNVSCDFKAGEGLNFHIRVDDAVGDAFCEIYTWGGPLIHANTEDGSWPGWVDIAGSEIIAGEYNNVALELAGGEVIVTLNGTVVANLANAGLTSIGSVQIASDAAAGAVGSLHIDNVVIGE